MTYHKQTIIEGINPKYGPYKIECDVKIANFIKKLNDLGVKTFYSCQGDYHGDVPYIAIAKEDVTSDIEKLVLKHWRSFIIEKYEAAGNMTCYYAYRKDADLSVYHELCEVVPRKKVFIN